MVVFGTNLRREHIEKWRGCFVVDEMLGFKIFVNCGLRIDISIYQRPYRTVRSKQILARFIHHKLLPMQAHKAERKQGDVRRRRGKGCEWIEATCHVRSYSNQPLLRILNIPSCFSSSMRSPKTPWGTSSSTPDSENAFASSTSRTSEVLAVTRSRKAKSIALARNSSCVCSIEIW